MRYVLDDIQAGKLPTEIRRRGIAPEQRLRVVLETLDAGLPLARLAEEGGAFDFLKDEPDLYTDQDIKPS